MDLVIKLLVIKLLGVGKGLFARVFGFTGCVAKNSCKQTLTYPQ